MSPHLILSLLLCLAPSEAPETSPNPQPPRPASESAWESPEHWTRLLDTGDVAARRRAFSGLLGHMGSAMLEPLREPFLRAMSRDEDALVRTLAATVVARNHRVFNATDELKAAAPFLTGLVAHEDAELRVAAILALGAIGDAGHAAAGAVPAIRHRLREGDSAERMAAVGALGYLGGEGLADLTGALADEDLEVARQALHMFEQLKARARPAMPALVQLCAADDQRVMLLASGALAHVDRAALAHSPLAEKNVARCIEVLRDPESEYGGLALQALPAYGARGAKAIPAIIAWYNRVTKKAKGTPDQERVEGSGLYVAGLVVSMREAAFEPLVEVMATGDVDAKGLAAVLLGNFTQTKIPLPDEALPPLLKMLEGPDPRLHVVAANVLDGHGARAKAAVPALLRMLAEDDADRRQVAAEALHKIDREALQGSPQAEALIPGLIAQLDGKNQPASEAADLLCLIGPKAVSAVRPILRSSLRADLGNNGSSFRHALKKMGPAAVPELVVAVQDDDPKMRRAACDVLYFMGATARDALPALDKVSAQDESKEVRVGATIAIGEINRALDRRRALTSPASR